MKCVFCGCTQKRACTIRVGDNPPRIRQAIRAIWRDADDDEPIGCSWFETDPPVCSAPACVKKHEAELTAASRHSLQPSTPS